MSCIVFLGILGVFLRKLVRRIVLFLSRSGVMKELIIFCIFLFSIFLLQLSFSVPILSLGLYIPLYFELSALSFIPMSSVPPALIEVFVLLLWIIFLYLSLRITLSVFFLIDDRVSEWRNNKKDFIGTIRDKNSSSVSESSSDDSDIDLDFETSKKDSD